MTRQHKKTFPWFLWHRRIGLLALLLVVILAITGIALNHTEQLKLDHTRISNDWLLDWYGLNPEGDAVSFKLDEILITQWGDKVFFNDQLLIDSESPLIGAARTRTLVVLAFSDDLLLLDHSGDLIEQISPGFMPINRLGLLQDRVVAETQDAHLYRADKDLVTWERIDSTTPVWSKSETPSLEWQQKIKRSWRGDGLTAERVILDLHSGRIFHPVWGVYLMDAAAILMLLLGFSGVWIWWSRRQKLSSKKHFRKHHH